MIVCVCRCSCRFISCVVIYAFNKVHIDWLRIQNDSSFANCIISYQVKSVIGSVSCLLAFLRLISLIRRLIFVTAVISCSCGCRALSLVVISFTLFLLLLLGILGNSSISILLGRRLLFHQILRVQRATFKLFLCFRRKFIFLIIIVEVVSIFSLLYIVHIQIVFIRRLLLFLLSVPIVIQL